MEPDAPDSPGGSGGSGSGAPELEPLGAAPPPSTGPRMLIPLFLIPLLIVAVVVGVFLTFSALVGSADTAEDLLVRLESGGVNDRWQAAASLADIAVRDPAALQDPALRDRLRRAFRSAGPGGSKLRCYLVEVLGQLRDTESGPLVAEALENTLDALAGGAVVEPAQVEEVGAEVIRYARALGRLGDARALPQLVRLAGSPDAGFRQQAAASLGELCYSRAQAGDPVPEEASAALLTLHGDADGWVRMNAALSLAKLGRAEGLPTLELMLSRENLRRQGLLFPDDGQYTVGGHDPALEKIVFALVAIESLARRSGDPEEFGRAEPPLLSALRQVAADDPSEAVRSRAQSLLSLLEGRVAPAPEGA